jgi:hypothetical protein
MGGVMAAIKPKIRDDLTMVELDGEAVIYDGANGQLHYLNPTATLVFGLCDGRSTIRQFSEDIAQAFGVDRREIERQVRALLRQFKQAGFLNGAPSASRS